MPGDCIKVIFCLRLKQNFNSFTVDKLFKNAYPQVIVGHEDGMVRAYELPQFESKEYLDGKCVASYETKGGPIQALFVQNITKLHANDLVVADSRGIVTVFCNEQILSRKIVSEHCVQYLQVDKDSGNSGIVAADAEGSLCSFTLYNDLWRLRLTDIRQLKGISTRPKVSCLIMATLNTTHEVPANYVLVVDDAGFLCFLQNGLPVLILNTPSNVTAMCCGKFIEPDDIDSAPGPNAATRPAFETQVALGTSHGAIYIMTNFELYRDEFANISLPITQLHMLPATNPQSTDFIIAAGNFDSYCLLKNGRVILQDQTPSWINNIVISDFDHDGVQEWFSAAGTTQFTDINLSCLSINSKVYFGGIFD